MARPRDAERAPSTHANEPEPKKRKKPTKKTVVDLDERMRQRRDEKRKARKKTARAKRVTNPKGRGYRDLPTELVIHALEQSHGLVSHAARMLNCHPKTIYQRAKTVPEVADAIKWQREVTIDDAEGKLFDAMQDGQQWAVLEVLRKLGKGRGYGEGTKIQLGGDQDGVPIEVSNPAQQIVLTHRDLDRLPTHVLEALLGLAAADGAPLGGEPRLIGGADGNNDAADGTGAPAANDPEGAHDE